MGATERDEVQNLDTKTEGSNIQEVSQCETIVTLFNTVNYILFCDIHKNESFLHAAKMSVACILHMNQV